MKRLIILMAMLVMLDSTAYAEPGAVKPHSQGDVTYVSGGVGADEKAEMEALRGSYNLQLLFALRRGEYLSGVRVAITDGSGHAVLDAVSDGPMFFVNLQPGAYKINAELDGRGLEKTVNVGSRKATRVNLLWAE